MRTVTEEEALEIANVIHELGKKFYSKQGVKFLEEAKKFLNEKPCWVEEEPIHPFYGCNHGHERICIIGGLHGIGISARAHHGKVLMIDAQMTREVTREAIFSDELDDFIISTRVEFGCGLNFPLELLERAPDPFPFVIQSLSKDFCREDFQASLREENECFRDNNRKNQNAQQRKQEHFFRSKSHSLKTCNARVFRGPWLARGNIAQF